MITRQDVYEALFLLKDTGVDESTIDYHLNLLSTNKGINKETILFLTENSPIFQFYNYIHKHQKALMKSILNYTELSDYSKIKTLSSFITRVMIAIEYNNISSNLIELLELENISNAINNALSYNDYSEVDEVLENLYNSMKLFVKDKNIDVDNLEG